MNLDRTSIDFSKYDLFAVAAHEIDEVLGFGSALNNLNNGDPTPTGPVWTLDLFRYDQNGAGVSTQRCRLRLTSRSIARICWCSSIKRRDGDFSDWFSTGAHTPRVQDAFATPGATPNPGIELIGLDVLGYNWSRPKLTIVRCGDRPCDDLVGAGHAELCFTGDHQSHFVIVGRFCERLRQSGDGRDHRDGEVLPPASSLIPKSGHRWVHLEGVLPKSSSGDANYEIRQALGKWSTGTAGTKYLPAISRHHEAPHLSGACSRLAAGRQRVRASKIRTF